MKSSRKWYKFPLLLCAFADKCKVGKWYKFPHFVIRSIFNNFLNV